MGKSKALNRIYLVLGERVYKACPRNGVEKMKGPLSILTMIVLVFAVVVTAEPMPSDTRFEAPGYHDFLSFDEIFNEIEGFDQEPVGAQGEFVRR